MADPLPFDREAAEALAGKLGAGKLAAIVAMFLESAPDRMERVRAGLRDDDLDEVAAGLHSLRSSASMLGARGLERAADDLERLARAQHQDELTDRAADLERAFAAAEEDLRAFEEKLRR